MRRFKKVGTALIFEHSRARKAVHGRLISALLELSGGWARPLMAHLAETGKLGLEDLREIDKLPKRR